MRYLLTIWFLIVSQFCTGQNDFYSRLVRAVLDLTNKEVTYDPGYYSIPYPNGDVPSDKGACTDVIIRAYRTLGIDLQKEVHEDMRASFSVYPKYWGLSKPDPNIDHRRVPNLMTFFSRKGQILPITDKPEGYAPGDIVCWDLGNGVTHIGFVVNSKSLVADRFQIVHNIGSGQVLEDCLFRYKIIGHYRYEK